MQIKAIRCIIGILCEISGISTFNEFVKFRQIMLPNPFTPWNNLSALDSLVA